MLLAYKNTLIATLVGTVLCVISVAYMLILYPGLTSVSAGFYLLFLFSMVFNIGTVAFYMLLYLDPTDQQHPICPVLTTKFQCLLGNHNANVL